MFWLVQLPHKRINWQYCSSCTRKAAILGGHYFDRVSWGQCFRNEYSNNCAGWWCYFLGGGRGWFTGLLTKYCNYPLTNLHIYFIRASIPLGKRKGNRESILKSSDIKMKTRNPVDIIPDYFLFFSLAHSFFHCEYQLR